MYMVPEEYFGALIRMNAKELSDLTDSYRDQFPHVITVEVARNQLETLVAETETTLGKEHPMVHDEYSDGHRWSIYHPRMIWMDREVIDMYNNNILKIAVGFVDPTDAVMFKLRWHGV